MSAAQLTDHIDLSRPRDPVEIVTSRGTYLVSPRDDSPFVDVSTPSGHTYKNMQVNPDTSGVVRVEGRMKVVTPRPAPRIVHETDKVTQV